MHHKDTDPNAKSIDVDTPLKPFRKSQIAFVTSADARSTGEYGYTYPEIAALGNVAQERQPALIREMIRELYHARDPKRGSRKVVLVEK